jgi:PAS domain S-box-containing protein
VLTFVDISRLKRAQKDLRHMTEVFQEGANPTIIVDLDGNIIDLNEEAMRTYGYAPQEILGKSLFEIIPDALRDPTADLITRCRGGETIQNMPWSLHTRSSAQIPVLLTLNVLTGDRGEADAIALVARIPEERGAG